VRSARTRLSVRSRRQRFRRAGAQGVQCSAAGNVQLVQCRDFFVKHISSPSRRDVAASHSSLRGSTSVRRFRTPRCPTPLCRVPQPVFVNPPAGSTFLAAEIGRRLFSYPERTKHCTPRLRNLDTKQPFSYCYELPTQLRLESVATRTPPPICTSALGSLTALVRRAWGAASEQEIHDGEFLTIR